MAQRPHAAFESARHAAELAAKACFLDVVGHYPRDHRVGPGLAAAGRVPPEVAPEDLARFLAQYLLGRYGEDRLDDDAVAEALRMARRMVDFARR